MKKKLYILLFIGFLLSLSSCEDIVDVKLRSIEPKLVIDAAMQAGEKCIVTLTKTQDFANNNPYQQVSGATITLSDNEGLTETLTEIRTGVYESSIIMGTVDRNYTLTVTAEGKSYQAQSVMPDNVTVERLYIYNIQIGGKDHYLPAVVLNDPIGIDNYYYFVLHVNDKWIRQIELYSDRYKDGTLLQPIVGYDSKQNNDKGLEKGDKITIQLQSINVGAYDYYLDLASGATANPISNFTGGVLGVFKTYNSSESEIVISDENIYTP